jgi:putative RNA 2'-phosphotransferase
MPVAREALEANWQLVHPSASLWHGTRVPGDRGNAEDGVLAGQRSQLHLAESPDSQVGKRSAVDLLDEVSAARRAAVGVFRSANGVLLVRYVPRSAITGLKVTFRAGRAAKERARELVVSSHPVAAAKAENTSIFVTATNQVLSAFRS